MTKVQHPEVTPEARARYLSPDQVMELIPGMTKANLAQLRFTGKGPRYRKPTPKTVLYVESEVIDWIENSARYGTALEAV
ncbi:putative DNA-binding transcriptional regulator AlpA [Mycetocola sp. CAN_C7]|uniref:helix-turn-helix transcriptional regulator n=1 Tax=Mycetocola sp. CAN_C7 TaxID=2787724 RepID=UPI0018C9864B